MIGSFFKFLTKLIIFCMILVCLAFVWVRWAEPSLTAVKRTTIKSVNLPQTADGLRIVQFTDTHFGFDYDVRKFSRAVEKINSLEPHIVVFTGDLFEDYTKFESDDEGIISALKDIKAVHGKYAVLGNHDYGHGSQNHSIQVLEAGGFTVLRNDSIELELLGITLTGIDDCLFGKGGAGELDELGSGTYNLAICHEPDIFADAGNSNLDLMLSGHTHGGQIRVPLLGELTLPPMGKLYPMGKYDLGNARGSTLYVNSGLGTSKLPMRLLCIPEITLITLEKS